MRTAVLKWRAYLEIINHGQYLKQSRKLRPSKERWNAFKLVETDIHCYSIHLVAIIVMRILLFNGQYNSV